jgi:hypothetical protein
VLVSFVSLNCSVLQRQNNVIFLSDTGCCISQRSYFNDTSLCATAKMPCTLHIHMLYVFKFKSQWGRIWSSPFIETRVSRDRYKSIWSYCYITWGCVRHLCQCHIKKYPSLFPPKRKCPIDDNRHRQTWLSCESHKA